MVESSSENQSVTKNENLARPEKFISRFAVMSLLAATSTSAYFTLDTAKDKAEYAIAYPVVDDTLFVNGFQDVHNLHIDISDNTFSFISRIPVHGEDDSTTNSVFEDCHGSYEYVNFKLTLIFSDLECESTRFIIDAPEDTTDV